MWEEKKNQTTILWEVTEVWRTSKEQNAGSQRKMPLILGSSYKCQNRILRKGKGLVFSLADSNHLFRKVVIVCFSMVVHATLLQLECVYASKLTRKTLTKPWCRLGFWSAASPGWVSLPSQAFSRGTECLQAQLIQCPRHCSQQK